MIVNSKVIDFAIFDFDGTLVNLQVNWGQLRRQLNINSIEEIWELPSEEQETTWELISQSEVQGVSLENINVHTVAILRNINFAVLTNNCEQAVEKFLNAVDIDISEVEIIGRNWLGASKTNANRFNQAVRHILIVADQQSPTNQSRIGYFGDSDYELRYAKSLGLTTFKIDENGQIQDDDEVQK